MSWTDARVKTLTDLWIKGKSASEIAKTLGNVSRNAVIGKANRLGLSGRPSPIKNTSLKKIAAPAKEKPITRTSIKKPTTLAAAAPVTKGQPSPTPVAKTTAAQGASIFTLNDRMCKWPEGDPRDADFHFCGKSVHPGLPYCQAHAAVAYQPARRREDNAPRQRDENRKNNAA